MASLTPRHLDLQLHERQSLVIIVCRAEWLALPRLAPSGGSLRINSPGLDFGGGNFANGSGALSAGNLGGGHSRLVTGFKVSRDSTPLRQIKAELHPFCVASSIPCNRPCGRETLSTSRLHTLAETIVIRVVTGTSQASRVAEHKRADQVHRIQHACCGHLWHLNSLV